ncbi:MAG: hypothetical protein CM15mP12_0850 [Gammaproteobacteria bacterium]|nr:MAG: hypothetical protein CM15mP12_0850 [Gammaproteobacteria bacterium]
MQICIKETKPKYEIPVLSVQSCTWSSSPDRRTGEIENVPNLEPLKFPSFVEGGVFIVAAWKKGLMTTLDKGN